MGKVDFFMPGRLCLFGEHSDWAAKYRELNENIAVGMCIILGLELGLNIEAQENDNVLFYACISGKTEYIEIQPDAKELLNIAQSDNFFSYACAAAYIIINTYSVNGIMLNCYKTTLPVKVGLGSSAAICMSVIRAYNLIYRLNLNVEEEMKLAYEAEIIANSKCGMMDQLSALNKKVICVEFDKNEFWYKDITVKKDLFFLVVDLDGSRNTRKILEDLNSRYPFENDQDALRLFDALGNNNIHIVNEGINALESGNIKRIGELMNLSQEIFDQDVAPYSVELISPKLHILLNDDVVKKLSFGRKGVGAQGDGAAQIIVKNIGNQYILSEYIRNEYGYRSYAICISRS